MRVNAEKYEMTSTLKKQAKLESQLSRPLIICVFTLLLTCCASQDIKPGTISDEQLQAITEYIPSKLLSLNFEGGRKFSDESNGATYRYSDPSSQTILDSYIYPVANENKNLVHSDLVMVSTRTTIQAIGDAVKQGIYTDVNVIGASTFNIEKLTVAKVVATYKRRNLSSIIVIYQTEKDGVFYKARCSAPSEPREQVLEKCERAGRDILIWLLNSQDNEFSFVQNEDELKHTNPRIANKYDLVKKQTATTPQ